MPLDPVGGPGPRGPRMGSHPGAGGPRIDFAAIDANGDGALSREELETRATGRLSAADTNGDGALDRDELVAALPGPRDQILMIFAPDPAAERADRLLAFMGATDAGRIGIEALADRQVNAITAALDTDHDGAISQAEATAKPAHARGSRGHGDAGGHRRDDRG
ncbi:hypothetical protein FJM51_12755 [Amaricoccus solimangrovi]|uniref:EF-hand domain-containing protein n=2 Tax=Amaricoccus solimangrovi TaxID=2589815 RepID=A0A501WLP8_9RHOB|nr:hypothetical protein FJM51_12755 [Amaricoccus solimangrovi]